MAWNRVGDLHFKPVSPAYKHRNETSDHYVNDSSFIKAGETVLARCKVECNASVDKRKAS